MKNPSMRFGGMLCIRSASLRRYYPDQVLWVEDTIVLLSAQETGSPCGISLYVI
jgi:hypothetical protein